MNKVGRGPRAPSHSQTLPHPFSLTQHAIICPTAYSSATADRGVIHLKLKEQEIESDPSTKNAKVIPTFHAYSPSADISAEVVFVNYGTKQDYSTLRDMGLDAKGAIVIAKYGKMYRVDIVEIVAGAGAVGVLVYLMVCWQGVFVYSDPRDGGLWFSLLSVSFCAL
jgi:hypothetical protein